MRLFLLLIFACATGVIHAIPPPIKLAVDQGVFDDLVFYLKYASSAYVANCPNPNGNTLVKQMNDAGTDTQGFIALDSTRKEIVVSMTGSSSPQDFLVDADVTPVPLQISGVNAPDGTTVHEGFQKAWNSVVSDVLTTVQDQLDANPGFNLVSTGHTPSAQNFPNSSVRMFTYGQPRTGNAAYASFVNDNMAGAAFRAVHTTDGVPTLIPQSDSYQHHGTEFFQNPDPASAQTTKMCDPSGEDPTCSDSIPSQGIDAAHLTYFNIVLTTPFCN